MRRPRFVIRKNSLPRSFSSWVILDRTRPYWIGRAESFEAAIQQLEDKEGSKP